MATSCGVPKRSRLKGLRTASVLSRGKPKPTTEAQGTQRRTERTRNRGGKEGAKRRAEKSPLEGERATTPLAGAPHRKSARACEARASWRKSARSERLIVLP